MSVITVETWREFSTRSSSIRRERAALKAAIRADPLEVETLLIDQPPCIHTMRIDTLLAAIPYVGPAKIKRLLNHCRVPHGKPCGELTTRQVAALRDDLYTLLARRYSSS